VLQITYASCLGLSSAVSALFSLKMRADA